MRLINNKIQALLIGHLQRYGALKLFLPDGIILEVGTNQVDRGGELVNTDDYCWIIVSKDDKMAVLDSYNLGLRFSDESKSFLFDEVVLNEDGEKIRRVDVV